ncbi:hypothetical protein LN042_20070 [Kitasatospora sp. RB6PN24]|uniref:hypothetical protein n=1 Tax=Kitasatospora humi TaxID=2893891 RepID=UPI001E368C7A|nr:hypothetical protein [Kitasatospora humi]MCC9309350.1 hypothetical protein [Kitasatospora humi]
MQVQLAAGAALPALVFAAATPEALVLLDGVVPEAGGGAGEPGCRHGTPWFVRRLGVHLLARLTDRSDRAIAECLADAVAETAALHGGRCDLADPAAPAAAVLAARLHGASLEYLLLGGPQLVLDTADGPLSLRDGGAVGRSPAEGWGRVGANPRAAGAARTGFVRLADLRALAALTAQTDGGGLLRRLAEGGAAADEPGLLLYAVC